MRGQDLSSELCVWRRLAESEMRIWLMEELNRCKLGLPEVENYSLGLGNSMRSKKFKNKFKNKTGEEVLKGNLVGVSMKIKLKDEKEYHDELVKERDEKRKQMGKNLKKNSKTYRAAIKTLRLEATKIKNEKKEKYKRKIEHLKKKYRLEEEEKLAEVPKEMEEYKSLSIFNKEKFEEIEVKEYKVQKIGEVKTSKEEDAALVLHPKCAIMERLDRDDIEVEKEIAFAKLRMTLNKELEERVEGEKSNEEKLLKTLR